MSNEELVKNIQGGVKPADNMEQLYKQNYGYIRMMTRKYTFDLDDLEDLMQEAFFGLYEAVKRYEDTAGVLFLSYATFWIKQSIKRYLENNGRCIRIPVKMQADIYKFNRVMAAFHVELGRKPTDRELCHYIGVGKKTLEEIKKVVYLGEPQSLDEYLPGSDNLMLCDAVPDPAIDIENNVIDGLIEESKKTELWKIVKDNITQEENTVIAARFRKDMTLDQTGQLIGKSRDMARQIEAKALRKLRRPRITRLLEEKFEINYARAYRGGLSSFNNTWNSIVEDIAIRNLDAISNE